MCLDIKIFLLSFCLENIKKNQIFKVFRTVTKKVELASVSSSGFSTQVLKSNFALAHFKNRPRWNTFAKKKKKKAEREFSQISANQVRGAAVHRSADIRDPHTATLLISGERLSLPACCWIVNAAKVHCDLNIPLVLKLHFKFRWALSLSWQMCRPARWGRAGSVGIPRRISPDSQSGCPMCPASVTSFYFL